MKGLGLDGKRKARGVRSSMTYLTDFRDERAVVDYGMRAGGQGQKPSKNGLKDSI